MKQLVKLHRNWADEFYAMAFIVWDSQNVDKFFALAEVYFELFPGKEFEVAFGTRQQLTFRNLEHFKTCFEVSDLDDAESQVFFKHFRGLLKIDGLDRSPIYGTGHDVFDLDNFYDKFFDLYEEGKLPEDTVEKLKRIEPEFESWFKMTGEEKDGDPQ